MKTKEEIILDLETLKLHVKDNLEKAHELIHNNPRYFRKLWIDDKKSIAA